MEFGKMPYSRPDMEACKKSICELTARLEAAESYDEAKKIFLEYDELQRHLDTLVNIAYIRHSIDTRDAFYDEEKKFFNNALPEVEEYNQKWTEALLKSPFRK